MADLDAARAAQAARMQRLAPPPPVVGWYPQREPVPEPEPEEEEESIFALNLNPAPVVSLPSSDTSQKLAMRARRQRQAAADAADGSLWSLVTSQLSDPTTTAALHDLMAAAGIVLADTSAGPVPRAEFGPVDVPDDYTRRAREAWCRVADEMGRVLTLAAEAAEAEAAQGETEAQHEQQHFDSWEVSAEAEAARQDEVQELSGAPRGHELLEVDGGGSQGADDLLLDSMLVLQQVVAAMSSLERQGRPVCAPQAMRVYKLLQALYDRARTLCMAS